MPDQSSASTEHALMQEIAAPLSTLPADAVHVATDVDFPLVLRGYDRVAVDAYVKKTGQLVAELQATRSPEAAVRRALERVGTEVAGILQRAHDTAEQITAQSRREADDRLEAARREAEQITAQADVRVKDLDAETDRIWEERQRIVEDARLLAGQLLALADSASARFPAEAEDSAAAPGADEPFGDDGLATELNGTAAAAGQDPEESLGLFEEPPHHSRPDQAASPPPRARAGQADEADQAATPPEDSAEQPTAIFPPPRPPHEPDQPR